MGKKLLTTLAVSYIRYVTTSISHSPDEFHHTMCYRYIHNRHQQQQQPLPRECCWGAAVQVNPQSHKKSVCSTHMLSMDCYMGAETWQMNKTVLRRIHTVVNRWLREQLGIQWMDKVSSEDFWERTTQTNQVQIEMDIMGMAWSHLEKPNSNITKQALTWNHQGKRKKAKTPLAS